MHEAVVRVEPAAGDGGDDVVRVVHPAPGETLCLVADGLGGHGAGRLAATIAVETIVRATCGAPLDRTRLPELIRAANTAIVTAQRASVRFARMRTTLVLLHLDAASAFWLHCGDSRLYHVRGGRIAARTLDHSVAQMHSDGDSAVSDADRNLLLRSLGSQEDSEARPRLLREPLALVPGDRFLLCTDGFWRGLDESLIAPAMVTGLESWLDTLWQVSTAAAGPDRDDAAALAVGVCSGDAGGRSDEEDA